MVPPHWCNWLPERGGPDGWPGQGECTPSVPRLPCPPVRSLLGCGAATTSKSCTEMSKGDCDRGAARHCLRVTHRAELEIAGKRTSAQAAPSPPGTTAPGAQLPQTRESPSPTPLGTRQQNTCFPCRVSGGRLACNAAAEGYQGPLRTFLQRLCASLEQLCHASSISILLAGVKGVVRLERVHIPGVGGCSRTAGRSPGRHWGLCGSGACLLPRAFPCLIVGASATKPLRGTTQKRYVLAGQLDRPPTAAVLPNPTSVSSDCRNSSTHSLANVSAVSDPSACHQRRGGGVW